MGWKTLEDAAKAGPSRETWERRVEGDRVPHYLDAASGRRMVWIDASTRQAPASRDLGELRQTVAELRALMSDLRKPAVAPRRLPRRHPAPPIRARTPRPAPVAPVTPLPQRQPPAISEADVARVMALRASCPLGDKALQRAAGLASNWFWKVKRGQCRSSLAAEGWRRLEAFLGKQGQRRAA